MFRFQLVKKSLNQFAVIKTSEISNDLLISLSMGHEEIPSNTHQELTNNLK